MAIWYDANQKKYSNDGKESVIKSYIDERISAEAEECEERLEAHADGTSLRHSAEDVDYGTDKTVKEKIDDVKEALDTERALRIAQGQGIMSEIDDLKISTVYDNNALYNAIEVLKSPGDSENFGMVRTEGTVGGAGKAFMCKMSETAQDLNNYIYTGMYYLKIYAFSRNLPESAGYEMVSAQGDKAVLFVTECDGRVNQRFYCTHDGASYERNGNTFGIFSAWEKTVSPDEFESISDRMDYLDGAYHDLESMEHKGVANGYAPLDGNKKIPEKYIYGKTAKEYGIRWTGTSVTTCTRLGDAAGLTAQAYKSEAQTYHSDFDDIYPWSDMKLCNVDENGQVTAYIGEPNFKRDGSNGDVMVEIPKFYYKRTKTGKIEEWWICGEKLGGYELHPAFTDGGEEVQKLFVGAYNGSVETVDGTYKLRSKNAVLPAFNDSTDNFRTYAQNKNPGATAEERRLGNWGIEDYACLSALQMLYTIEFADMNSKNAIGAGVDLGKMNVYGRVKVAATDTNKITISQLREVGTHIQIGSVYLTPDLVSWRAVTNLETVDANTYIITISGSPITVAEGDYVWEIPPENGTCDFLSGGSGNPGTGGLYDDVCYRGIEGFFGKFQQFIDGISHTSTERAIYVSNTMNDYGSAKTEGTYKKISYLTPDLTLTPAPSRWISEFGFDQYHKWVLMPIIADGSANTYISAFFNAVGNANTLVYGKNYRGGTNKIYTTIFAERGKTADYNGRLMFKK